MIGERQKLNEGFEAKDVGKDLKDAYDHGLADGMTVTVKSLLATREMIRKLDSSISDILKFLGYEEGTEG